VSADTQAVVEWLQAEALKKVQMAKEKMATKGCEIQSNNDHVCDWCLESSLYCVWLDLNMRQKACNWCIAKKLTCTMDKKHVAMQKEHVVKKRAL